jgi:micrococcal nuclease
MDISTLTVEEALTTKKFSLNEVEVQGIITKVYDGDSVHAVFFFRDVAYTWVCRLDGVDTPELRTTNENEKIMGYAARDALREKILHKQVWIRCGNFDKYGRLLITLLLDGENVNNWLIEKEFAYEYHGGTKREW